MQSVPSFLVACVLILFKEYNNNFVLFTFFYYYYLLTHFGHFAKFTQVSQNICCILHCIIYYIIYR